MRRRSALFVALLAWTVPASLSAGESASMDLTEYRVALRALADSIQEGELDRARSMAEALRGVPGRRRRTTPSM